MTKYGYAPAWFHHKLARKLEAVERGEIQRLMVFMPPQHGKSELCSKRFPAWYLGKNPHKHLIMCSYAHDLAQKFGGHARDIVGSDTHKAIFDNYIDNKRSASSNWETNYGGGMVSCGIDGGAAGNPADGGLIIDDPIKNHEQSLSDIWLNKCQDWYKSVGLPRIKSYSFVIVIMTRWNVRDLAGWLLEMENKGDSNFVIPWEVVRFPAIDDDGNYLWPEEYSEEYYEEVKHLNGGDGGYYWNALYQGQPFVRSGNIFKPDKINIINEPPHPNRVKRKVYYWDKAGTKDGGAYSSGVQMYELKDGYEHKFVIANIKRGQWAYEEREKQILSEAEENGKDVYYFTEQEPGSGGKESAERTIKMLAGYRVQADRPTGKKELRAEPFAIQVNYGNIGLVNGPWVDDFIEELRHFPAGKFKDQVDAASGAFNMLAGKMKKRGGAW